MRIDNCLIKKRITIEIEDEEKPALIVEFLEMRIVR
jgi:hypothetical protein